MKKGTACYLWEKAVNIAVALYYFYFAHLHLTNFVEKGRVSSLLFVIFESVLVITLLLRGMPKEVSASIYDWTIGVIGAVVSMLMRPAPEVHDNPVFYIFQLVGISVSIIGLLSLNKSFGIVAANRGVKINGLYKYVRHPIYAGYFLSIGMFCIQNATSMNLMALFLSLSFQILRIMSEEKFLSRDPAYQEYKNKTRWRLLPFVW